MKTKQKELILFLLLIGLCATTLQSQMRNGKFGIGIFGSGNLLNSDLAKNELGLGGSVELIYALQHNWGLRSSFGYDGFRGKGSDGYQVLAATFYGDFAVSYNLTLHRMFDPFIFAGAALMTYYPRKELSNGVQYLLSGPNDVPWSSALIGGLGCDFFINEFWSISISVQGGWLMSDNIDNIISGGNDTFERVSIGVRYYLFDKDFVKKMIETIKNRER
ncbi:MAG: outer membrane beta-barrel protein [Bacteroidota bacterium]|jgi:hypothetical protein